MCAAFYIRTAAVTVTLLAFAAVRRAACCGAVAAGRACGRHAVQQSIDIACPRAPSSKPAAAACGGGMV